jgi:hypothetical protein
MYLRMLIFASKPRSTDFDSWAEVATLLRPRLLGCDAKPLDVSIK